MKTQLETRTGTVEVNGHRTWYKVVGDSASDRPPLLCIHGGPGSTHDYLEPLEELARDGRNVIFYDQLGVGNSDKPDDPELWTVDLFLRELAALRRELGLDRVHLLGQSWGGMLALEYLLQQPTGVYSVILANSLASMPQWIAETGRLRNQLPPDVIAVLDRHEAAGTTDSQEYEDAAQVFNQRHLCRLDPVPDCVQRSRDRQAESPQVYATMIGPSEFNITGTLKHWTVVDRLPEIKVPTLVLSGRHDEATPAIAAELHEGIKGSEQVIFESSSHMPHVEEPEAFFEVVGGWLRRFD